MGTKNVLHFGLNRSGTNYLKELLLKHFDLTFLNAEERDHPLHKHFRIYKDKTIIGRSNFLNNLQFDSFNDFEKTALSGKAAEIYFIISKDPYSWNLSYRKWGEKNNWGPAPHPPILEYNEFYRKWLEFSTESSKIYFVKYVDLITDRVNTLEKIKERFGLNLINKIDLNNRIKKVPRSHRFTKKRLKYYLNKKYLKEYHPEELQELNKHIDQELTEKLGYNFYH